MYIIGLFKKKKIHFRLWSSTEISDFVSSPNKSKRMKDAGCRMQDAVLSKFHFLILLLAYVSKGLVYISI